MPELATHAPEDKALRPLSSEHITRRIEHIVQMPEGQPASELSQFPTLEQMGPSERVDRFYSLFMAHAAWKENTSASIKENPATETKPFNPGLMRRMQALWTNEPTRALFVEKYGQASVEYVQHHESAFGKKVSKMEKKVADEETQYEEGTKQLFLGSNMSPDDQLAVKMDLEDLVYQLSEDRLKLDNYFHLKDPDQPDLIATTENTDALAFASYNRFRDIRKQLSTTGFYWFDSQQKFRQEALIALTDGRWPLFIGEAGTGKSVLATATAKILTGDRPMLVACTPQTSEGHLIARMAMAGDETYQEYGAIMQAATGFADSRAESTAQTKTGRIVRLDELFKLGEDSPVFAILKEAAQIKPEDTYRQREILKGFKIAATTNPAGVRYNNAKPNPALLREFAPIEVDYLKMTAENPELYDLMIGSLMDNNGVIVGAAERELAPAWSRWPREKILPDGRKITDEPELTGSTVDPHHGIVYRMAYAVRAVQDAFLYGNDVTPKADSLRMLPDGTIPTDNTGELIKLTNSTITPGDVRDWLEKFRDRRQLDHPIGKTSTLTEYVQEQLKMYINHASPEDRQKLEAIFSHFRLFDQPLPGIPPETKPLTPKEIGYLSPRVPRPLTIVEPEPEPEKPPAASKETSQPEPQLYQDREVMLEDGSRITITEAPFNLDEI